MTYSTINTEINRIQENIQNSYDIAEQLGAILPQDKNSANLSSCLDTIDNYPLIPSRMNGLCFWLDGDYNTRNGLDRSKKYFENLVWTTPYTTVIGNNEITHDIGNNKWINNLLHIQDGQAYYPQPRCTDSNEYTIELVVKMTQETPNRRVEPIISLGSPKVGSFTVYLSPDRIIYMCVRFMCVLHEWTAGFPQPSIYERCLLCSRGGTFPFKNLSRKDYILLYN